MRVLKTKEFNRYARKEKIDDACLCDAVERLETGLIDANLGGGLVKQRIARQGQGRSRGYRTIIAFRSGDRSVFLYGFSKSSKANLSELELDVYKQLAGVFLGASVAALASMEHAGELIEVKCNGC